MTGVDREFVEQVGFEVREETQRTADGVTSRVVATRWEGRDPDRRLVRFEASSEAELVERVVRHVASYAAVS